jgi:hypothetical protein
MRTDGLTETAVLVDAFRYVEAPRITLGHT